MRDTAQLRHGRMHSVRGGRVAVHFLSNPALDGEPVRADLVLVGTGQPDERVVVGEGDRFTLGPNTWVVQGIDNVGTHDYVVRIAIVAE
jgi:Family of unknown function (DUF6406)